jgi:hypothetical protein
VLLEPRLVGVGAPCKLLLLPGKGAQDGNLFVDEHLGCPQEPFLDLLFDRQVALLVAGVQELADGGGSLFRRGTDAKLHKHIYQQLHRGACQLDRTVVEVVLLVLASWCKLRVNQWRSVLTGWWASLVHRCSPLLSRERGGLRLGGALGTVCSCLLGTRPLAPCSGGARRWRASLQCVSFSR